MTAAALLATASLAQTQRGAPDPVKAMEALQHASQQLRDTVQAIAQKPMGADRDRATQLAHQALLDAQRALAAIPPDAKPKGPAPIAPSYDESMAKLKKATERLHESVQALAKREPGPQRNQAMGQARQALWEAHQAIVALPAEVRWMAQGGAAASVGSSPPAAK
jgi:hypothetical protein